jgi:hypothetical protein
MKKLVALLGVVTIIVVAFVTILRAESPPAGCSGSPPYKFEIQASKDGGATWSSSSMVVTGRPSQQADIMIRTRMTVTSGQTEGWSFSLKYNASALLAAGGNLSLNQVTTTGTGTATVKGGSPPDTNQTSIRSGFNGYTQGVLIDNSQAISLAPTTNFVTSKACYHVTFTPAASSKTVTFTFTHDIGSPIIRSVISQNGLGIVPCASNFTMTVTTSLLGTVSPGGCSGFGAGPLGPQGGGAGPLGPQTENHDKFIRGDSNGDGTPNLSDAIFTLGYLFLGGTAPPCLDAADSNDDSSVAAAKIDLTDPVYLLNFLFTGGSAPPTPYPSCGVDGTIDNLTCTTGYCDNDGDGLLNSDERQRNTDPNLSDTDNDGFTDGEEVLSGGVGGLNIAAIGANPNARE